MWCKSCWGWSASKFDEIFFPRTLLEKVCKKVWFAILSLMKKSLSLLENVFWFHFVDHRATVRSFLNVCGGPKPWLTISHLTTLHVYFSLNRLFLLQQIVTQALTLYKINFSRNSTLTQRRKLPKRSREIPPIKSDQLNSPTLPFQPFNL